MPLVPGQTLSSYELLAPLGAGAMGEVWRARDTRLGREVAVKVLPEHFADDEERLQRFEREARSLAALNHPHVAQIFGVDQVEDTCFLVLELVPGETLEERIARGPLPPEEAVDVVAQIAAALEAAHRAGVIHRDLKPANVRITPDGQVKVLDFGLAKPTGPGHTGATSDSVLSTEEGRLIGTPTYMAPEQARGRPIDARVDLWALGCVLYECLTGRRAFAGATMSDVLAAVLRQEPDWGRLPAATPPHVRALLARCLAKDPRERLRDAGDAWLELTRPAAEVPAAPARRASHAGRFVLAFVAGAALAVLAVRGLSPGSDAAPPAARAVRFALESLGIRLGPFYGLAISPDGSRIVYRANGSDGVERLHLRALDSLEATELPGTERAALPFFAPDGDRVGFFDVFALKSIRLSTGSVRTIASLSGFSGGAWMADDTIVFTTPSSGQLSRVHASGGTIEELLPELGDELDIATSPYPLPDGEAFLVSVRDEGTFDIAVCEPTLGKLTVLAADGIAPVYSASGHVLYQQGQSGPLMALPFDARRRVATGAAFPVQSDLGTRLSYQMRTFALADDGTLVYVPESSLESSGALVWVDGEGAASPVAEFEHILDQPRLSHDGRRVVFRAPAPDCDLWVHDLGRGVATLITHEGDNHGMAWAPDDGRIAFARQHGQDYRILATSSDGAGAAEPLSEVGLPRAFVADWSPDGKHLLVVSNRDDTKADVDVITLADGSVRPLLRSVHAEDQARFSPDGRYVSYVSDESGRTEVYVQPFPDLGSRVQISTAGGSEPVWSPAGDRLFYRADSGMFSVDVTTSTAFAADRPSRLFDDALAVKSAPALPGYDVSADGRFLMVRERAGPEGATIHVVLNWFTELERAATRESR